MSAQRPRTSSISGRLRSVSDLCDDGILSPQEKGSLKNLIIMGEEVQLERAFAELDRGNARSLKGTFPSRSHGDYTK